MDYLTIGAAPYGEACAQVGDDAYEEQSRRECAVFARMLKRLFPVPAGVQARFKVKSFGHDFGMYREVVVEYEGPGGAEYAYAIENGRPEQWDSIAQWELFWYERRDSCRTALREGRLTEEEVPECLKAESPPEADGTSSLMDMVRAHGL